MKTKGDKSRILQGHVPSIPPCVATKTLVYNIFKFFPSIFFFNYFGNWECIVSGYDLFFFYQYIDFTIDI